MMRLSLELEKVSLVNGGQGQLVPEWEVRSGQWGWSGQWCQGWGGWELGLDRGQDNIQPAAPGHLCCTMEVAFLLGL